MSNSSYHGLEWQRRNYPILDLVSATKLLREKETTSLVEAVGSVPVTRVDILMLDASSPCQDNFTSEVVDVGTGSPWQFWGVFDGHAGWQTSTVLSQALVSYVARELKEAMVGSADTSLIDAAIKRGFTRLDNDIVQGALKSIHGTGTRAEIIADIAPAVSGSMAVLAMYDPDSSILRVASVGDSRAVLGRFNASDTPAKEKWEAVALSTPQTPDREDELALLLKEHPDEPDMIANKRLLGIPVTRAFGDNRWKWPAESLAEGRKKFYAFEARPNYKSPPYLHAEPEISTTSIKSGDFAILATDGLWDTMSAENAVKCINLWIDETNRRAEAGEEPLGKLSDAWAESKPILEEELETRVGETWCWNARPEDFVCEDANAATHLVRNTLGGNRREQFCTVMGVLQPTTYDARDDTTVQVVFFGDVVKRT